MRKERKHVFLLVVRSSLRVLTAVSSPVHNNNINNMGMAICIPERPPAKAHITR